MCKYQIIYIIFLPFAANLYPSMITMSLSFLGFSFSANLTETMFLSYISANIGPKCSGYNPFLTPILGYSAFYSLDFSKVWTISSCF